MKIAILLFAINVVQISANVFSQNTSFTLNGKNLTAKQVIEEIEKQTDYRFIYRDNFLNDNKTIDLSVENENVESVLPVLLANLNLDYLVFENNLIVITPQDSELKQGTKITGTVIDAHGTPLPGVNIVEVGTNTGAVTDLEGNYSITVSSEDAVLRFSFVGYLTEEIEVGGQKTIDVMLVEDIQALDEVVVVGYATQRAKELTGSISSVNSEQLENIPALDVSEALKGTASGVTATETNTPGEGALIRIRGLGTINNNDPLLVVDGVPGATVVPSEVESISILKDASSQAIYGARAANGVILVTTKSGRKNQKTKFNFSVKQGVSRNISSFDLLNTQEYGEYLWLNANNEEITDYTHEQYGSGPEPTIPDYIFPARVSEGDPGTDPALYDNQMVHEDGDDTYLITKANKEGTDWLNEISQDAPFQQYDLEISGGSENTTFAFIGSYLQEQGILKHTGYERYSLRSNVTSQVTNWLEIGEKLGAYYNEDWGDQANYSHGNPISWTYRLQPIIPVYDIMGNHAGSIIPGGGNGTNAMFDLWSNRHDFNRNFSASGNFFANATILKGLSFKSLVGFDYGTFYRKDINYVEVARSERGTYDGLNERNSNRFQWNWTNTLAYEKSFGDHSFNVIIGTEAISNEYRHLTASRNEFFSEEPIYMQLNVGERDISNSGGMSEWSLFSQFGRLNYNLNNKYLMQATVRRDGSSRFGTDYRYGVFPAFSVGWRISEEGFMSFSDNWLNDLKVRAGWGQAGNDQIGNYNAFTTYTADPRDSYYPITGSNSSAVAGFQSDAIGNPDTHWERTVTTNIGINATVFNSFSIILDLWQRQTTDMLYQKRIPDVMGNADAPALNIGEMRNKGIDLELGYNGSALNRDLLYSVSLNISHWQNEIVKLSGVEGEYIQSGQARAEKGHAYPEFYGYIVEGIFQTQEEADAHPTAFGENGTYNEPGHFKYKDVNEDGIINADDRTFIGSPHPDLTSGLNLNLQYKDFRISTFLYSSLGNKVNNQTRRYIDFHVYQGNHHRRTLYESWGSPYLSDNRDATMPKVEFNDDGSKEFNSYFVEDGSYLRMENIIVGYNLVNLFSGQIFNKLELFGQITNLFTITNYSGLDPEVGSGVQGNMNTGTDQGSWPTPRQYLLGLKVGF